MVVPQAGYPIPTLIHSIYGTVGNEKSIFSATVTTEVGSDSVGSRFLVEDNGYLVLLW